MENTNRKQSTIRTWEDIDQEIFTRALADVFCNGDVDAVRKTRELKSINPINYIQGPYRNNHAQVHLPLKK